MLNHRNVFLIVNGTCIRRILGEGSSEAVIFNSN